MTQEASMFDVGTIGSAPCQVIFSEMLNRLNDPKITHLLMRKYNSCVDEIVKLKKYILPHDRSFYISMVLRSRDINMTHARSAMFAERPMPYELYTHWLCVMSALYGDAVKATKKVSETQN